MVVFIANQFAGGGVPVVVNFGGAVGLNMVATGQEMVRKKFFKVREKSGNFIRVGKN